MAYLTIVAGILGSGVAQASLLYYDGFNYANSAAIKANWNDCGQSGTPTLVTGLSLGSLSVAGGAAKVLSSSTTIADTAGVAISSGDMWTSFLFNQPNGQNALGQTRAFWGVGSSGNLSRKDYSYYLSMSGAFINCASGNSTTGDAVAGTSVAFTEGAGTTYLAVGKVPNMGGSPGIGLNVNTMWVFDLANFNNLMSAGVDEANLTIYANGKVTSGNNTNRAIVTGDAIALRAQNNDCIYDEYRVGTGLLDVVVVPEPTSVSLGLLALGLAALNRRRIG